MITDDAFTADWESRWALSTMAVFETLMSATAPAVASIAVFWTSAALMTWREEETISPVVCERLSVTSRILRNISLRFAAMVLMAPPSSEISLRPRTDSVWERSPDAILSAAPFIASSGRMTSRLVAAMPSSRARTTAATTTETRAMRARRCTAATCSRVSFISPPTVTSRSSIAVSTLPVAAKISSRISGSAAAR